MRDDTASHASLRGTKGESRRPRWTKAPWCVVDDDLAFRCTRCGGRLARPQPVRLSAYLKYADAFQEEHEFCRPPNPMTPAFQEGEP
jgi:hypothetical protein